MLSISRFLLHTACSPNSLAGVPVLVNTKVTNETAEERSLISFTRISWHHTTQCSIIALVLLQGFNDTDQIIWLNLVLTKSEGSIIPSSTGWLQSMVNRYKCFFFFPFFAESFEGPFFALDASFFAFGFFSLGGFTSFAGTFWSFSIKGFFSSAGTGFATAGTFTGATGTFASPFGASLTWVFVALLLCSFPAGFSDFAGLALALFSFYKRYMNTSLTKIHVSFGHLPQTFLRITWWTKDTTTQRCWYPNTRLCCEGFSVYGVVVAEWRRENGFPQKSMSPHLSR